MNGLQTILDYAEQPLTSELLLHQLKAYNRPYDKIDELVKKEILIQIRRGLYLPGKNLLMRGPEAFLLANHLYGPSYVSRDSALFYWGLIPERVYETSSICLKKSRAFKTAAGNFSYIRLPLPYYSFGFNQVALTEKQTVLLASPEKALCDKIITTSGLLLRSNKQTIEYLTEDLRIEKEQLRNLDFKKMRGWIKQSPKRTSIQMLVKLIASL